MHAGGSHKGDKSGDEGSDREDNKAAWAVEAAIVTQVRRTATHDLTRLGIG